MSTQQGSSASLTIQQRITAMTVPERVRTALHGSGEERAILIRDSNRLVAAAVVNSPKVTIAEIEAITNMRNLNEEILRMIGTSREWLQHYAIVANLVKNPKTPLAIALKLLPRLSRKDLMNISRDKNIAEALQKTATRMIQKQR